MAGAGIPKTCVELRISCSDLTDRDKFSKSDPCCVVKLFRRASSTWEKIAVTETVKDSLSPQFTTPVVLDYFFEEVQKLQFTVYDVDRTDIAVDQGGGQTIGSVETTLGTIISNRVLKDTLIRPGKGLGGKIVVHSEEVSGDVQRVKMSWRAAQLDKKDFLGKSDPYLEICRGSPSGDFVPVFKTEVIKNNLNPSWRMFTMDSRELCNSDASRPIKLVCYDWDSDGSHDLIGVAITTLGQMVSSPKPMTFELINEKKKAKKKGYVNSGVLYLDTCSSEKLYSFLDFIYGGCQVNFSVGIDFTGSNGNPTSPKSLHYLGGPNPSQYTQALRAVGNVCQQYDSDKMFPAFGFGAKFPDGQVSHDFPLNFNPQNPYLAGIEGVIAAYEACVRSVTLWGPTNASPIINHTAQLVSSAEQQRPGGNYFVLLLLTDGELTDMTDTKRAIIAASNLPMSIIIVGVGPADFSSMRELDADEQRLRVGSQVAERDIVQFVPFRDFAHVSPEDLAKAVLAEVPAQVVEYMACHGIHPGHTK